MAIALRPNQDTIKIWNKSGSNKQIVETIKEDIERIVKMEEGMKIDYENFKEVLAQDIEKKQERAENKGEEGD